MEWFIAYLLLGAIVGFLSGLFGIGGGMILVPVLLLMFSTQQFPAENLLYLSLGTSMATIMFTSLSSMRKHHQHGAVIWHVVGKLSPGILLGAGLGTLSATSTPQTALGLFFALFVYFVAAQILLDIHPHSSRQLPGLGGMALTGTFTGWISTMVSIGGGTIIVPFLIWCNTPIRNAIGTSAAIGFPIAIGGTIGYILTGINIHPLPENSLGFVYLPALFSIALSSVITAPLGAKATHRMNIDLLRKLFSLVLIVLASKMLWEIKY